MLANYATSDARGQITLQRFPVFAVVRRNENIRTQIVAAVSVKRRVHGAFSETRRHDTANVSSLGNSAHLSRQVLPGFAAILRDLQVAVIRAGVKQTFFHWRFSQRHHLTE